jgi:transcriptional regulator with XRE-family HTH domain
MIPLKKRAQAAVDAGFLKSQLAKAAGVSPSAVSQWLSGETVDLKAKSAAGLAALTGWSANWWANGIGPRDAATPVAQTLSHHELKVELPVEKPVVQWGAMTKDDLPDVFLVEVPDNAMADRVPKGFLVEFDKRITPRDGDGILVADSAGAWFFRVYRPSAGGDFAAIALNAAGGYLPMSKSRHGLEVLAVYVAHTARGRWG